ncbi:hypothetical protein ACFQV2_18125 [Actinokineospora soli]|uniref:ARB-07466-like C-terminal domain-containing protein n=1 Tax=Actinokineospora soli TaxID=1048753 RepID=A0ABW2TMY8_9PSEU
MTKKNLRLAAAKSLLGALVASTALTLAAVPQASAAPATPSFGPAIDGYAAYDAQDTCDPVERPGVVEFRALLNQTYGAHDGGITRACHIGGVSEHKEGRALDYHFDITNPEDAAEAADVLNWLLATDQYGNKHAMFRRLGLMYVIWNRQIWSANKAEQGWQPYVGDPHTNHIHFSFSWAGALKQTTWFTSGQPAPTIGRIGILQGSAVSVKEGGLYAGWTNQYGGGIAKFETDGDRIGVLTTGGDLLVKDGTLYEGWVPQAGGVADFHLAGDRIGIRRTDRTLAVKEGDLYATWTEQIGDVADFDLTPSRIGVVTTGGLATVKEGNLFQQWVNQLGGAADIELAGNRVGVRRGDGTLAVKDGDLYAPGPSRSAASATST